MPIDATMTMMESVMAVFRLPMKLKFVAGIKLDIVMDFRMPLLMAHSNKFRVTTSAVNIEAMTPMMSETANPFTGPVACQ